MATSIKWFEKLVEIGENNRLGMFAAMMLFYGNIVAPATLLVILSYSGSPVQFFLCAITGILTFVLNLAQMPARIIIPMFAFTNIVHLLFIPINLL